MQPHLSSLPGLAGTLFGLLTPVFSTMAAVVQVLHEPEEGQFIEEDLGDLHQEVFSTVLQGLALKLRESVLSAADGSDSVCGLEWLKERRVGFIPGV